MIADILMANFAISSGDLDLEHKQLLYLEREKLYDTWKISSKYKIWSTANKTHDLSTQLDKTLNHQLMNSNAIPTK